VRIFVLAELVTFCPQVDRDLWRMAAIAGIVNSPFVRFLSCCEIPDDCGNICGIAENTCGSTFTGQLSFRLKR